MANSGNAKKRIALARRLYEIAGHLETHGELPEDASWSAVRKLAKSLMRNVASMERDAEHAKKQALAERDLLKSEVHMELVDRDANAARVAERQRFLFDRAHIAQTRSLANDHASASAAFVEAAIVALCPHHNPPSHGCEVIANAQKVQ